jgi:hypothetical protein
MDIFSPASGRTTVSAERYKPGRLLVALGARPFGTMVEEFEGNLGLLNPYDRQRLTLWMHYQSGRISRHKRSRATANPLDKAVTGLIQGLGWDLRLAGILVPAAAGNSFGVRLDVLADADPWLRGIETRPPLLDAVLRLSYADAMPADRYQVVFRNEAHFVVERRNPPPPRRLEDEIGVRKRLEMTCPSGDEAFDLAVAGYLGGNEVRASDLLSLLRGTPDGIRAPVPPRIAATAAMLAYAFTPRAAREALADNGIDPDDVQVMMERIEAVKKHAPEALDRVLHACLGRAPEIAAAKSFVRPASMRGEPGSAGAGSAEQEAGDDPRPETLVTEFLAALQCVDPSMHVPLVQRYLANVDERQIGGPKTRRRLKNLFELFCDDNKWPERLRAILDRRPLEETGIAGIAALDPWLEGSHSAPTLLRAIMSYAGMREAALFPSA